MDAFLTSTLLVAVAEIGDRTQLLSLLLIARFRRPPPIIAGILVATLANHALAGLAGAGAGALLGPDVTRWVVGLSFIAFAAWTLKADTLDGMPQRNLGAFATTAVAFFLVEIGDKTQIATVALAAKFQALAWVVVGTTLGMMAANVPVLYLGAALAERLPLTWIRMAAAALFALTGLLILLGVEIAF